MSSESDIVFYQFLTLNFFKKQLKSTDSQDDETYLEFVDAANLEVHKRIFPYIDTPIGEGSQYWSRCNKAALAFARSLHAEYIELIEKSKAYDEKFEAKIGSLVKELIATRTNRTKTIVITNDPREIKVALPGQNDLFATERFA